MDTLKFLLQDSRFYAALLAFLNVLVFYFWPTFPKEVWAAINVFAGVILALLVSYGSVKQTRALRAQRAVNAETRPAAE